MVALSFAQLEDPIICQGLKRRTARLERGIREIVGNLFPMKRVARGTCFISIAEKKQNGYGTMSFDIKGNEDAVGQQIGEYTLRDIFQE